MRQITVGFETGGHEHADLSTTDAGCTLTVESAAAIVGNYGLRCVDDGSGGSVAYETYRIDGSGIWDKQGGGSPQLVAPNAGVFYIRPSDFDTGASGPTHIYFELRDIGAANRLGAFGVRAPTTGAGANKFFIQNSGVTRVNLQNAGVDFQFTPGTAYRVEWSVSATGSAVFNLYAALGTTLLATRTQAWANPFTDVYYIRFGEQRVTTLLKATTVDLDLLIGNDSQNPFGTGLHMGNPGLSSVQGIKVPNGAGTYTDFTKAGSSPAATNWEGVDDTPPVDDDVTYNKTGTATPGVKRDSFAMQDYTGPNTPRCITVGLRSANDVVGIGSGHTGGLLDAGSEGVGGSIPGTTVGAYAWHFVCFGERVLGGPWTPATVNAVEGLYLRTNAADPSERRFSAVVFEVEDNGIQAVQRRVVSPALGSANPGVY